MVGYNLMLIFKVFAETVPVSKPAKFLPAALALRVCSKSGYAETTRQSL
jgi:hypothetical protein